jgi:uncharacterized protein (TIRG00374 family)
MSKFKKATFFLLKVIISVSLVLLFYRRVSTDKLIGILEGIDPAYLVTLFGLLFFNTFISTVKWKIFLSASGLNAGLFRLYCTHLAGSFLNIFMPSNIGGDVYRIYDTGLVTADSARSFASVLADRLTGFLAIVILGLVGAVAGLFAGSESVSFLLPLLIFFAVLIIAIYLIYQQRVLLFMLDRLRLSRHPRLMRLVEGFFDAFQQYRKASGLFSRVTVISLLFQFQAVVFSFFMAKSLDIHIPFVFFLVYIPLVSVMESIPLTIFGVGFREAGYAFFMVAVARPMEDAMALSLLYVLLTLVYSSLGGLVLLLRHLLSHRQYKDLS